MKRLSFIITALILSLSIFLFSCDNGKNNEENDSKESTIITTDTTNDSSEETSKNSADNLHVHSYGEWVIVEVANCQKEGSRVRVCSCGRKENEILKKLECNYVANICTMCKNKEQSAFIPDYGKGEANVVGSDDPTLNYTAQGRYIYYSNGNMIQKLKKNENSVQLVYTASSGEVLNVNVVGDWIYFYCMGNTTAKSYIAKVRTDGSDFKKLVSSVYVWEMLVVKDTIYYTTNTENWEYVEYGKDVFPLYSVSVNGGSPKQIYDGAVEELTADSNYLYFIHDTEDDKRSICRIKHSNTSRNVLLQNDNILGLSLENSKLYFFVMDKYEPFTSTLASISINGGSYTTYGNMCFVYVSFHVIGNKAYFSGYDPANEDMFGLIAYDMSSKTFSQVRKDVDNGGFVGVFDSLICEIYDYDLERLEYIEIYNPSTNTFKKVTVS